MLNKKIILILTIFLVSLFAISAVSAADNATDDVVGVEETTDDVISVDEAEEVVSAEDNQEILGNESDVGTFDELSSLIANTSEGDTLESDKNYKFVHASEDGKVIITSGDIAKGKNALTNTNLGVLGADSNDVEIIVENFPDKITANKFFNVDVAFSKNDVVGYVDFYIDDNHCGATGLGAGPYAHFTSRVSDLGKHTIDIKYSGGNYNPCQKQINFTVDDYVIDVFPYPDPFIYGDDTYDFMVNMADDMNGILTLIVNGAEYELGYDADGNQYDDRISVKASDLRYGVNNVTVEYTGDRGTNVKHKPISFNITANYVGEIAIPEKLYYKQNANVTLVLPADASGALVVNLNGKSNSSRVVNGKAAVTVCPDDIGYLPITAKFVSDDGKYFVDEISGNMLSNPVIDYPRYVSSQNITLIQFEAPEKYSGNFKAYIMNYDTWDYDILVNETDIVNGGASLPICLPDDTYDLKFIYHVGGFEGVAYDHICFLSCSHDFDFSFNVRDIFKTTDQTLIEIEDWPDYAPMDFLLKVDGVDVYIYGYPYDIIIDASKLDEGMHTFNLAYPGNSYFNPIYKSGTFNVSTVNIDIPQEIDMDKGMDIHIGCAEDISGKFTVKVDGKVVDEMEAAYYNDNIYVYEGFEKSGIHDVEVIYVGNYGNITKKAKVNATYYVSVSKIIDYGGDKVIINAPNSIIKKLDIIIDGVNRKNEIKSNEYYYYIPMAKDFKAGNHTVVIKYAGDKTYPAKTFNQTFEVIPTVVFDETIIEGDGISLIMPEDSQGNLVVMISERFGGRDNLSLYANVSAKGKVFIPLDNLTFGTYYLKFNYTCDDYNVYYPNSGYILVSPHYNIPKSMIWKSNAVISLDESSLDLASLDLNRTELSLEVDDWVGTFYAKTDIVTGKESISLSKLPAGTNTVYARLNYHYISDDGDDVFEYFDASFKINVINPIVANDFETVYGSGASYKAKIIDLKGKPLSGKKVTFYIDGKKVKTVKTNSKGIAALKITKTPKTYKIKTEYNKLSVTKTLKVHYVTLKTVTVKKSAKSLTLTATLCKIKGKYLKNKAVTFKFNGKTYKAKTNAKGVAKVTIKSSALKKLKVGKKVTYQATYLKDTVKKTAKVKK